MCKENLISICKIFTVQTLITSTITMIKQKLELYFLNSRLLLTTNILMINLALKISLLIYFKRRQMYIKKVYFINRTHVIPFSYKILYYR